MFKFYLIIYTAALLWMLINICDSAAEKKTMAKKTSIYYNLKTKTALPIGSTDSSRLPSNPMKFISGGLPCSCNDLKCGCCVGINLTAINFDRQACTNITFLPEEFALDFHILMDDNQLFTNRLTARNPPPACVPLYFFPAITFCVRFFDLQFLDNKFKACIDFETKVAQLPMFIMHFNCMAIGDGGVTSWMTSNSDTLQTINTNNRSETEVYDQVNFELSDDDAYYLHTSTLTPEEEDNIGTLKLT